MLQNWMQVLDAYNFLQLLDATSISASKVIQVPPIFVIKQQQKMQAYMQPNFMQVLDADNFLQVLDSAYFSASKVNKFL